MELERKIKLTDDPMENIKTMIPMLNNEQRRAVSHVMFGFFIGEEVSKARNKKEGALRT